MDVREARTRESADAKTIERWLPPYLEELDSLAGTDSPPDYPYLSLYWSEPGRRAFVFVEGSRVVGFALVRGPESTGTGAWEMAEFYIVPEERERGYGRKAALQLWRRFPGPWEVEAARANEGAVRFWARSIQEAVGAAVEPDVHGESGDRVTFRFVAPVPPN